jgi:exodeoxyribonuclease VII large subunit
VRSARSAAVAARLRVQEAAMSPAFDETRERLHEARARVGESAHRIETLIARRAQGARRHADAVSRRLSPARLGARVSAAHARFIVLRAEQSAAVTSRLEEARARLASAAASLDALSPLAVLRRGYSVAEDQSGVILRDARRVRAGEVVRLRLAEGALRCRVEEVENN